MIYTCTLNPAIDLYIALKEMRANAVNRTEDEDYQPNGKGVNVSIMLKKYGFTSTALGFIAGFSGSYIEQSLKDLSIQTDFISVEGITRINVFINTTEEYKLVNQGPAIEEKALHAFREKIAAIPQGGILIMSGSLPKGVPASIFSEVAAICHQQKVKFILDTSSAAVLETLQYKPYLLKPNEEEIAAFFGKTHPLSEKELIQSGEKLIEMGAEQVLISRGEEGALFITKDAVFKGNAPTGTVVNTACSGDAMLAAFLSKHLEGHSPEECLRYGIATGASTAFSKGLSDLQDIDSLIEQVHIQKI
ncbi:1-phosphofructokinase [Bacillus safensis]|uniref:Tagatose-6-phosphate kinase n=1 Tax=Bacillus safensis TaxID=561879 RepID=A0A5C0WKQ3_BACIA|nr:MULTISPECIES: 1-phosphofructokinase [Bacillus]MBR0607839.1 1-phosphofructokinase [Bacillus safensis]QEK65249.1 Tagatose-6-phosphate kinase [Bacillus safensis]QWS52262.1 1-phosphofructokinase [Bacillus sp. JNUCC-24]WJE40949.1 1-phosphofructokinase [Bacillus safensis]WNF49010.1 1-phosphofructokinase [Bacillus sp. SG20001]